MICKIKTAYIKLDSLLKFAGIADTGGFGKQMIEQGYVFVNGGQEVRRGRKIYPGDRITVQLDETYEIEIE